MQKPRSWNRLKTLGVPFVHGREKGMVLSVALMFMAVLALLGTAALTTSTTDMKIATSLKSSDQSFYTAQAGVEEGRARLQANSYQPVSDDQPAEMDWTAYVGSAARAGEQGYDSNSSTQVRYDSLSSSLDYVTRIRHRSEAGRILYWGDPDWDGVHERNTVLGENIYVIRSFGYADGAQKTIQVEVTRMPPLTVPSALYVEATGVVQGDSAHIIGTDACGGADKPGILATEPPGSVTLNGSPNITGAGGQDPDIVYNGTNMDVESMVHTYSGSADFFYASRNVTLTPDSTPGPGDGWGEPTPGPSLQDPSTCASSHIVHFDTGETYLKLSGGISGCGMLLVEGDLEVESSFTWHGIVVVTGSVLFTGGGDRNITGGVIAGGSAVFDVMGGTTNIVYCSSAITNQTKNLPLKTLTWKEDA